MQRAICTATMRISPFAFLLLLPLVTSAFGDENPPNTYVVTSARLYRDAKADLLGVRLAWHIFVNAQTLSLANSAPVKSDLNGRYRFHVDDEEGEVGRIEYTLEIKASRKGDRARMKIKHLASEEEVEHLKGLLRQIFDGTP